MTTQSDQVALVTGCSSGIGLATSVFLTRKEYRVYATMRNLERAGELRSIVENEKLPIRILRLDVRDESSIKEAVSEIERESGRIDVLVNNAGYVLAGCVEDLTIGEVHDQFETNFYGVIRVCQTVLPIMRRQRNGVIVNISSIGGKIAFPGIGAYGASKFALEGLSETMRYELSRFGIRIVLIEPGFIKTNLGTTNLVRARKTLDAHSDYSEFYKTVELAMNKMSKDAGDPTIVAETVYRAISDLKPRMRYAAGSDASRISLLRKLLPDSFIEKSIKKWLLEVEPD